MNAHLWSSAAKHATSGATGTVSVAMVGNPQMKTLEQLKGDFESSHPGITLNLLVLPENQVRDKVTTDIATNAAQFDLVTIGMYEVPLWAKNNWLEEVGTTLQADATYDYNDVIPSIRPSPPARSSSTTTRSKTRVSRVPPRLASPSVRRSWSRARLACGTTPR